MADQLPLIIPPTPVFDEASFLAAPSNLAARTFLGHAEAWPEQRLALWGDADRGKTYLLRIWSGRHGADVFDGPSLCGFPELTSLGGAAVDDADQADEAALLHLLNTAHDLNRPVLLAARLPPARWNVALKDLVSRLRAITSVEVEAPDDELMRRLLLRWLAERQMVASEALHGRLLLRLPRSAGTLRAVVERLDRDTLTSRRRTVTPAMVSAALAAVEQASQSAAAPVDPTEARTSDPEPP